MKKHIAIITAAALALMLTACNNAESKPNNPQNSSSNSGNTNNESTSKTDSKLDNSQSTELSPKDIESAIAKALGDGYLCTTDTPDDEIVLSCIGRLDLTKVDEYVVKKPTVYAMDTVGIVKCKEGYADEAAKLLNDNFEQCISYIRQYAFDVAKVEGTRIYKVGDIVMYITAGAAAEAEMSDEDAAKLAAAEYEKIDNAIKELFGSLPQNLAVIPEDDGNHGSGLIPPDNGDFMFGG